MYSLQYNKKNQIKKGQAIYIKQNLSLQGF